MQMHKMDLRLSLVSFQPAQTLPVNNTRTTLLLLDTHDTRQYNRQQQQYSVCMQCMHRTIPRASGQDDNNHEEGDPNGAEEKGTSMKMNPKQTTTQKPKYTTPTASPTMEAKNKIGNPDRIGDPDERRKPKTGNPRTTTHSRNRYTLNKTQQNTPSPEPTHAELPTTSPSPVPNPAQTKPKTTPSKKRHTQSNHRPLKQPAPLPTT